MKIWKKNFCYAAALLLLAGCAKKDLKITEEAGADSQPKLKTEAIGVHVVKTDLFSNANTTVSGMSAYHSYFAPSIVYCTKSNVIVAFAEGRITGPSDGTPSNIVSQRFLPNASAWSGFGTVVGSGSGSFVNPTAVYDPNHGGTQGRIWLFVNHYVNGSNGTVHAYYNDNSAAPNSTWTEVNADSTFTAGSSHVGVGPGNGIVMRSNTNWMVIPGENRNIVSKDGGLTWKQYKTNWGATSGESSIFEGDDGKLHRNDRPSSATGGFWVETNNATHYRDTSSSVTGDPAGAWRPLAIDTHLPDPKCEGSVAYYSAGNVAFCNSAVQGQTITDDNSRYFIKVRLSSTNGKTWSAGRYLYSAGAAGLGGYTSMTRIDNYSIGVLCNTASDSYHTGSPNNHWRIDFHRIDLNWINNL